MELQAVEAEIADTIHVSHLSSFNQDDRERLLSLNKRKDQLLLIQEISWRLKSRALWIEAGDQNTKYFHAYANHRKNTNSIWSLLDEEGQTVTSQQDLELTAFTHFKQFYSRTPSDLQTQVEVSQYLPRYFSEEEAGSLEIPVTIAEIKGVLSDMATDKSPGPDGWPVEFILAFFDLFENELIKMIEFSRIRGTVSGSLNSTFIALIPKKDKPTMFSDFRPISLCNLLYKIISKIISNRIKTYAC